MWLLSRNFLLLALFLTSVGIGSAVGTYVYWCICIRKKKSNSESPEETEAFPLQSPDHPEENPGVLNQNPDHLEIMLELPEVNPDLPDVKLDQLDDSSGPINEFIRFSELPPVDSHNRPLIHPSAQRVLYYLKQTHHSLDVCMEMITSLDVAYTLIDLVQRGVVIRIIVSATKAYTLTSVIPLLEKNAIEIYFAPPNTTFQNFCLIDTNTFETEPMPIVMFGAPWSRKALAGDNDHVIIVTSIHNYIELYCTNFIRMFKRSALRFR